MAILPKSANRESKHISDLILPYQPWPALPYEDFKATMHLLHRGLQIIGKLKLATPFEPQWANVALSITSRGLTTGPIPYGLAAFAVDVDLNSHQVICTTSWGDTSSFGLLTPMSVADLFKKLFAVLHGMGVNVTVNTKPQEVPDAIPFDQDTKRQPYDTMLAHAWWQILLSSQLVMQRYRAEFQGKTPPIGFMWGTFDLRDVRFNCLPVEIESGSPMSGYIRRNAMDAQQIEVGWWAGSAAYPRPAYYAFTYPQPESIEHADILPSAAHWHPGLAEFVLDYDDVRRSKIRRLIC